MNEQLFDIVCDYIDQDISDAEWQAALEEHGDALQQLYDEEIHIRQQVSNASPTSMPQQLRDQLKQIPQQHKQSAAHSETQKKPNLLFPILNTAVAVAACLCITVLAFVLNSKPEQNTLENNLALHDHKNTDEQLALEAPAAEMPEKEKANKNQKQKSDRGLRTTEKKSIMLGAAATSDKDLAADAAVADDAMPQHSANNISIEVLEDAEEEADMHTAVTEGAGRKERQEITSRSRKKEASFARGDVVAEMKPAEKRLELAQPKQNLAQADAAPAPMLEGDLTVKPAAATTSESADGIDSALLRDALKEARKNVASNQDVRDAIAKNKGAGKAQSRNIQREAVQAQGLDKPADQFGADKLVNEGPPPQLNLRLGSESKQGYLAFSIGMDIGEADHGWFRKAVLDMRVHGLDQNGKSIWQTPIKTYQVNPDIIELRSSGLPSAGVKTLVLHSLGQQSEAIAYIPAKSEMLMEALEMEVQLDNDTSKDIQE